MAEQSEYQFTPVSGGERLEFLGKEIRANLSKWGMLGGMRRYRFAYANKFEAYKSKTFFDDLFANSEALATVQALPQASSRYCSLSALAGRGGLSVAANEMCATVTDLTFFDRLEKKGLISASGTFKQPSIYDRMPDDPEGFDMVRMMLADVPSSAHLDLYTRQEKQELIFKVFSHLVLGGHISQYDESLEPYTAATAALYGKLVTPYRDPDSRDKRILLRAHVFQLAVKDADGEAVLPAPAPSDYLGSPSTASSSFAYAIVEPLRKQVTILSYEGKAGSWTD